MSNLHKAVRFFCAAAPGIVLGLWLSRMFGFWWPIGAFVGAGVSYLLVEWKMAIKAFPKALCKAWSCVANKNLWEDTGLIGFTILSSFLTVAIIFFGIFYLISIIYDVPFAEAFKKGDAIFPKTFLGGLGTAVSLLSLIVSTMGIGLIFIGIGVLVSDMMSAYGKYSENWRDVLRKDLHDECWHVIKFTNPLAVFLYWLARGLWNLPRGIKWFCKNVLKEVALFLGCFAREFLLIVHSQKRSLCAMTTLITVTIGYLADGNILVFTVAGAAVGALYSISPLKEWVVVQLQPATA